MKKVILSGYMGSGKSAVGRELSKITGLPHVDLDDLIAGAEQCSIAEIFARKGEIYFRKREHEMLQEALTDSTRFILSLGGGTPCYWNNHILLKREDSVVVFLRTSIAAITDRIIKDGTSRPVIEGKNQAELTDFISKHLFERSYYYNHAEHKIDTDGKTPNQIAIEIQRLLT